MMNKSDRPEGGVQDMAHLEKQDSKQDSALSPDTQHGDQAMTVLANYTGDRAWTPEEEKQVLRKIDRRLMPILCLTYGLQYYDKAMLGQAAIFGLREDLELDVGDRYSFSSAIFYLGFIAGAYPAITLAQRFPIERVAFAIVLTWGACLTCTAACKDYRAIYAQRFFLGFLESGISPMFMMVVGSWFRKQEQAFRIGYWYCMTGYVSIVSPLINYGLGHITGGALAPWQYMYMVAGILTVLWAFVVLFFMPPDPIRARGFTDRERYIAVARMRENNTGVRNTHFKANQLWELMIDVRFWLSFSMAFLLMIANGPVSTFAPILIRSFGYDTLDSLLLLMPAGAVYGTIQLLVPFAAYKWAGIRTHLIVVCQALTTMAALLLWLLPRGSKGGLLFGVYFLGAYSGGYAVLLGLALANTAGYTKRSLTSSGIFAGYCFGNFVGPLLYKPEDAPVYAEAFIAVVVTSAAAGVLAVVYRYVCVMENQKRDKAGTTENFENAYDDDLTDVKNKYFRYTY